MRKLYRVLWYLAILSILVTTVVFSMGIILVGTIGASVFGIYRYYLTKRKTREYTIRPYFSGEIIDIKPK
jgi:hypothetical protein